MKTRKRTSLLLLLTIGIPLLVMAQTPEGSPSDTVQAKVQTVNKEIKVQVGTGSGDDIDWNCETIPMCHGVKSGREASFNPTFGFGFNNFSQERPAGGADFMLNNNRSRYFEMGGVYKFALSKQGRYGLNFMTGLQLQYNNFVFDHNKRITPENDEVVFYNDTLNNVVKSKLRATYLSVPVMFYYQFPGSCGKGVSIGIGGDVGYRIGSKAVAKFNDGGKDKVANNFNLANWQYGLQARIGYGGVELFAKYSLSELFAPGAAPELNRFMFGLVL